MQIAIFTIKERNVDASLEFHGNIDEFILKSGSVVNSEDDIDKSANNYNDRKTRVDRARQIALDQGWNKESTLNKDIVFASPTSAADFVVGDWRSGTQVWKDENGQTIGAYLKRGNNTDANSDVLDKVRTIVDEYIQYVTSNTENHVKNERYKFDALKNFEETFDIDAEDIAGNLKNALSKVGNLAVGVGYYPVASICDIAANKPEEARNALRELFNEDLPDIDRMTSFQEVMIPLSKEFSHKNTSHPFNMDLRFISLLLSLRYPEKYMYFKATQVDDIYRKLYGEKTGTRGNDINRILKTRDLGALIQEELGKRNEYQEISAAMGYENSHNLWFAQDVIWQAATNGDGDMLLQKVKQFMQDNPDWRDNEHWPLGQEQIEPAVKEFQEKFHPDKLQKMTDEEILRWIPYREETTNDTLSYLLEHSPIIGKMGGIGGGSAAKLGYYQGKDGQWKKFQNNAVTTREDALEHRKVDIEVIAAMYSYIVNDDYEGLRRYVLSNNEQAEEDIENNISIADSMSRYKSVIPGLVWVRKYFTILFPDKFVELYGSNFVEKLEKVAGIGKINGDGKEWDYSLWYKKMNKISDIAPKLGITNYELSRIIWELVKDDENQGDEIVDEDTEDKINNISLNTIIYGPPGTGKTFSIKKYREELLEGQTSSGKLDLTKYTWLEIVLLAFKSKDYSPASIKDIETSEITQQFANIKQSKTPYATISTIVIENSTSESTTSTYRNGKDLFEKIENQWQLTETGRAIAEEITEPSNNQSSDHEYFYEFITFHQSYGYEEFIEGIRAETNDIGNISYSVRDGVFKAFCRKAESDPENNFLFVIDEINRGNISKIFGELITLIEPNKRLGASEEMITTLPYSGDKFGVPKNVYIVGTMNTADRSIALLDIALRRRFDFIEIMPNPQLLSDDIEGINLQKLLTAVNSKVVEEIDRNHQIGHSYLMGVSTLAELHNAWYQRVVPLLQEYFYDDNDDLRSVLKSFIDKDEVVQLNGESFKKALTDIYEEAQDTDSGIQL